MVIEYRSSEEWLVALDDIIRRYRQSSSNPRPERQISFDDALSRMRKLGFTTGEAIRLLRDHKQHWRLWKEDPAKSLIDSTLEFFIKLHLPDDIVMKVDRAAMMNSLESRDMFLDHDLVEFCHRLLAHFKYRNGSCKYR